MNGEFKIYQNRKILLKMLKKIIVFHLKKYKFVSEQLCIIENTFK